MKTYTGICACEGLAVAPVRRLSRGMPALTRIIGAPQEERARLEAALLLARGELADLEDQAEDRDNRDILYFQRCLLEDESIVKDAAARIAAGEGAAAAMEQVARKNADRLAGLTDNEYLQLRSADVLDACHRVVDILDRRPRRRQVFDHPIILASELLMPSDVMAAPPGMILGFVSAAGSPQSHAAIIARSMGIPGIAQVGSDFLENCDGRVAVLDATAGAVTLDPTPAVRQACVQRIYAEDRQRESLDKLRGVPCRTAGGAAFSLQGNCFGPEDIRIARAAGADAIGLVRSEYLLMRGYTPDEEEQYHFYVECLSAAGGLPVTVRTFDIGADRATVEFGEPDTDPELGLRGVRYGLAHPQAFEAQLCALLRAGMYGPLRVNLPMIGSAEDWQHVMQCVEHAKNLLRRRGDPFDEDIAFGMTFEIPAACLEADAYAALGCRFFTIGLNDLVQYTHAANRNSSALAPYYRAGSSAVRRLMRMVLEAGAAAGVPVSVGGLAVESPSGAQAALRMGLRTILLPAQNILPVKQRLLACGVTDSEADSGLKPPAADGGPAAV